MYTTEENKVTCLISFIYMTNYQNDLKIYAGIKQKIHSYGKMSLQYVPVTVGYIS